MYVFPYANLLYGEGIVKLSMQTFMEKTKAPPKAESKIIMESHNATVYLPLI